MIIKIINFFSNLDFSSEILSNSFCNFLIFCLSWIPNFCFNDISPSITLIKSSPAVLSKYLIFSFLQTKLKIDWLRAWSFSSVSENFWINLESFSLSVVLIRRICSINSLRWLKEISWESLSWTNLIPHDTRASSGDQSIHSPLLFLWNL